MGRGNPVRRGIHLERTRHGKTVYYYRWGQGRRVRLPDPDSKYFNEAYNLALAGDLKGDPPPARKLRVAEAARKAVRSRLKEAVRQARNRARRKGVAFDLTEEWVLEQAKRQKYRCAMSDVPFYFTLQATSKHNPYAPSLDRIVPALGYTIGNVRIVVFSMNMMLMDWGEEVFSRVADGYRHKQLKKRRKIWSGEARPSIKSHDPLPELVMENEHERE